MLGASLISSVLGLNESPQTAIVLFFRFFLWNSKIFLKSIYFCLLLTFLTDSKIFILKLFFLAIDNNASISFGKHDPP